MLYRAIGLMSGSSLDGLDLACVEFQENGGKWSFSIMAAECMEYPQEWSSRLETATTLNALEYQLLHTAYGRYLGEQVNAFIGKHGLDFKVALISSHGHTTFHVPSKNMTAQLGDGAAIAALTRLPVVSDLRAMDLALGGQGAPIVPIGEQLLFPEYNLFLNLGGIANVSVRQGERHAFDVCPANRVLNLLALETGRPYDENGYMAASGSINHPLLDELNNLPYYKLPFPKSLDNSFGTSIIYPLIRKHNLSVYDALATYVEHISLQIAGSLQHIVDTTVPSTMLITGGGALNTFLVNSLARHLNHLNIQPAIPDEPLIQFKEAIIMGLIGVLRWREESNVLSSVTGAVRDSVGGALWMGQEG